MFSLSVPSSSCPVSSVFLSLRKNTEWISMKLAGDNHYHQQIKWLYILGEIGTETVGSNIRYDRQFVVATSNRF